MKFTRHWSDWIGCTAFTFLWVGMVMTTPTLGLMFLPLFLHPFLSSLGFILRQRKVRELGGVLPRVSAYAGTFGVLTFFIIAHQVRPEWVVRTGDSHLRTLGLTVWFTGGLLDAVVVWSLRHSMSIVPQARKLLTTGPYGLARHPLYATYILEFCGMWLCYQTAPVAIALLAWLGLTLARIHYEERLLEAAFPEYAGYRARVGMFGPRLAGFRRAQPTASGAESPQPEVYVRARGNTGD